jgi:hypothetical protein
MLVRAENDGLFCIREKQGEKPKKTAGTAGFKSVKNGKTEARLCYSRFIWSHRQRGPRVKNGIGGFLNTGAIRPQFLE